MTTPRWLSAEEEKLWRLILTATRKVEHHIDNVLQDGHNLTTSKLGRRGRVVAENNGDADT